MSICPGCKKEVDHLMYSSSIGIGFCSSNCVALNQTEKQNARFHQYVGEFRQAIKSTEMENEKDIEPALNLAKDCLLIALRMVDEFSLEEEKRCGTCFYWVNPYCHNRNNYQNNTMAQRGPYDECPSWKTRK